MDKELYQAASKLNSQMFNTSREIIHLSNSVAYLERIEIKEIEVSILLDLLAGGYIDKEPIIKALRLEVADLKAKMDELEQDFKSL